jgi:integrase
MAYAEKKQGKPTGKFLGEVVVKGKRFRRTFDRKKDAEGYELYVKLTGEEPPTIIDGAPSTGAPTFAEVTELAKAKGGPHGKWKKGKDRSLMQRLEYCVAVIGSYEIQRVTRAVLGKIAESLQGRSKSATRYGEPLSNATINRYLSAASAVLAFAHNEEIMTERPPAAPYLDEEETKKDRDVLQPEQDEVILQLMREAGDKLEALCVEAISHTGLRRGELCERLTPEQITIEQVEDEDGTPVHIGVIRLHKGQTKNGKGRIVTLPPELAKQIRALIATGSMPKGNRVLTCFKRAVKRAGVSGNIVIHSLRHARVRRLRKAGVEKGIRKQLLGHMDDDVHDDYDDLDLEDHLEVAKKVEKYAGGRAEKLAKRGSQVIDFAKVNEG